MVFEMIATNSTKEPDGLSYDLNIDNIDRWDRSSQDRMVYTADTPIQDLDTVEEDDLIDNEVEIIADEIEETENSKSEEP